MFLLLLWRRGLVLVYECEDDLTCSGEGSGFCQVGGKHFFFRGRFNSVDWLYTSWIACRTQYGCARYLGLTSSG